jgi:hypothetical protein
MTALTFGAMFPAYLTPESARALLAHAKRIRAERDARKAWVVRGPYQSVHIERRK